MRIYLLILFLTGMFFQSQAQTETDTIAHKKADSTNADFFILARPEFPGGDEAFNKFITNRLMYPEDARIQGLQGTIYIQFIVEKDGSLSNIKVVEGKSLSPSCDQEAIRVISSSPKWMPGSKDGVPMRTKMVKPVKFALAGQKKRR